MSVFMDSAPRNLGIRFYSWEVRKTMFTTPGKKLLQLLGLPNYLVLQIEKYLAWFEKRLAF
jgi:hypothetical protein